MHRGFRCIAFVIVGWLALASANYTDPVAASQQTQAQQSIANSLDNIAAIEAKQAERTESSKETEPCKPGDDRRYSDLCAQWKAADAATLAAWLSGASVGGVLITLLLAFRANGIARRIGEAQVRCYLSAKEVKLRFDETGQPMIGLTVVNSGQSPARDFRWTFSTAVTNITDGWDWTSEPGDPPTGRDVLAQGEESFAATIVDGDLMSLAQLSDLLLGPNLRIKVRIIAKWTDVFEKRDGNTWRFEAMLPAGIDTDMALFPDASAKETENPEGNSKKQKHISDILSWMSGGWRGSRNVKDS